MKKFMLAYHGGDHPVSKEEGMAHMQKWKTWVQELGNQIINPGTPLPNSKLLSKDGVQEDKAPNGMNGFAILKAENMDQAIEIAKKDPFLQINGQIRVSEMMEMH